MSNANGTRSTSIPIPWLSALLLLAFVACSVQARLRTAQLEQAGIAALDTARDYFLSHPYLEAPPALALRLDPAVAERARAEYQQRQVTEIPTPPGVVRRQQDELEQHVQTALSRAGELPARRFAFAPHDSAPQTWLAYALLHVGNAALIGNSVLLLFFGLYLERSFGRAFYGALLAWLTLAGAAGWWAVAPSGATHGLVGSTPLLAGLAAAFAVRFAPRRDEGFYFAGLLAGVLWLALPPYATATWSFAGFELVTTRPPPAATAVYVPCLAAVVASAAACALAWVAGIGEGDPRSASAQVRDPRLRRALRAREAGRPREALELLTQHLAAEPDAYEAALAAYDVARELGRDTEISAALLRVIRIELRRGLVAPAIDHWLELVSGGIPEKTDASLLIHIALGLREHEQKSEAVRALRFALEHSDDRANHVIAARIARAARGLDPGTTEIAAWRSLASVELTLAERQALENLIGEILSTPAARAASYARVEERTPPRVARRAVGAKPVAFSEPVPAPPDSDPEPPPTLVIARPEPIEIEANSRALDAVLAVPVELAGEGVEIQTSQGHKKLVRFERIEAVSVAAMHGMGAKPVIFVDLVLNWNAAKNETLRVIRLRGDQFDPRRLIEGHASAIDALRAFVKTVIERSNGVALPDPEAALGRPFASFDELAIYQRAVLFAEGPAQPRPR